MHIYTFFQWKEYTCILLQYKDTDYLISKFLYGVFENNDFILLCDLEFFKFKEVKENVFGRKNKGDVNFKKKIEVQDEWISWKALMYVLNKGDTKY